MAAVCRPTALPRAIAARPVVRAVVAKASVVAEPVKLTVQSLSGSEAGSVDLAMKVAGPFTARHVVHRYLVHVRQNARAGTASTKTRAEVRGGGRKPGPQKGSGGARQGSIRTPLKRGGGVVFGPKPKDWSINLNKKERRLAMATALQSASSDVTVVDSFQGSLEGRKTKSLVTACKNVGVDVMSKYTLIITAAGGDANADVRVAGANIERVKVNSADCLQFYDILRADKIIMEQGAVEFVNTFYQ